MPEFHDAETKAKDLRMLAQGLCPECGASLETNDPAAHAEFHWPELTLLATRPTDAHRRAEQVRNYGKADAIDVTPIKPALSGYAAKAIDTSATRVKG